MMRRTRALVWALALASGLPCATGIAHAAPARTLVVAVPSEPPHADPAEHVGIQHDLNYHIYRKLYAFTPQMTPVPDLVAAETVSRDLRTWTLELKRNVTFSDGTPVNAAAVKYSIERMLDPARRASMAVLFSPIKTVTVKSDHVLEIETKEPFASLRHNLAHPNTGIISPRADRELGPRFGRAPVSAGPYLITEWVSGDRIVLTRFEGYQGPRPYYDQIVFRVVPTPETRLAMVERGEAQVAIRVPPTLTRVATKNQELQVIRLEGTSLFYFWLNLGMTPTADPRVRRALNLAVDRDAIMRRVALGGASPARSVMERTIRFSCPVGTLGYDPEAARRLLHEAGASGTRVRMLASEGQWELDRQVAEAVAGYLREAGLEPELRLHADVATFREASIKRDVHMGLVAWPGSTADPDHYLKRQLWGEIAGKPWNFSGYRNARVDALIVQGARTFDEAERTKIYCEAQRLAWEDQPWLILYRLDGAAVARADITGIEVYVNSQAHLFTGARPSPR
jgi:peptide/nickel transport system substrate-binding protein